jgi:hypothetical protein
VVDELIEREKVWDRRVAEFGLRLPDLEPAGTRCRLFEQNRNAATCQSRDLEPLAGEPDVVFIGGVTPVFSAVVVDDRNIDRDERHAVRIR